MTIVNLRDYPLPLYDGDLEAAEGLPANARTLKDIFLAHQGLMISSPEHNSSISSALKNLIDWVSRPVPDQPPLNCFTDKLAVLMSASPSGLGGLRGLVHVRAILGNIGVFILPDQVAIAKAHEAFEPDGSLKDPGLQAAIKKLARG